MSLKKMLVIIMAAVLMLSSSNAVFAGIQKAGLSRPRTKKSNQGMA